MPRKNEPSKKEIYKLWWEYLRRSKKYREFLDWASNWFIKNPKKSFFAMEKYIPKEFRFEKSGDSFRNPFFDNFYFWGDVFNRDFETCWEEFSRLIGKPVYLYSDTIEKHIQNILSFLSGRKGRKPTSEEFIEEFKRIIKENKYVIHVAVVRFAWEKTEELERQFSNIIRQKKRELLQEKAIPKAPMHIPTKPLHYDDVKRYLQVSDLRYEKIKWREIAKIIYPKREWNESAERALHIDFTKAMNIIRNVQKGIFPGKY